MLYRNLASALAITLTGLVSVGCCCPGRFVGRPIVVPPPVVVQPPQQVQPPPVVIPPNNPQQQPQPAQLDQQTQQFIAKNVGPNRYAGALAANSPFWASLRQKVAGRQYTGQKTIGGAFGNVQFSDVVADGGVLIGFFAGEDQGGTVGFLQPIYLTAQGEKTGKAFGAVRRPIQCFKAKTGYAVSGLNLRAGGVIDNISVVFAKVDGERLNAGDRYASPQLGGQGGGQTTSGTTNLIVGIHGKCLENAGFAPAGAISSIGFITVP